MMTVNSTMTKSATKILFICKKRNDSYGISYGLVNSCLFICNALADYGIEAKVVQVVDNNKIDAEVYKYKPTHVFIEALWVIPPKFDVLLPKYPDIKWYVRVHSKMPFIANEGISIEWFRAYHELTKKYNNFFLSANNWDIVVSLKKAFDITTIYHPNIYYPPEYEERMCHARSPHFINIGCFGSIRPMKNQLYQALAAISFGNGVNKKIRFHINSNRVEQKGEAVLKNIKNCFVNTKHELVEHPWMDHENFVKVVKTMDMGLQVSFSETFNIVAADFVWNNIPIVGSTEIEWLNFLFKANPNKLMSIIYKMNIAYYGRALNIHSWNLTNLRRYNKNSIQRWLSGI